MEEIWKTFKTVKSTGPARKDGTFGIVTWQVSNLGKIRKIMPRGDIYMVTPSLTGGDIGRRYLALGSNGQKYVHRIVAEQFVPNPDPTVYKQVDHIDGDKQNNVWTNLRWVTTNFNVNSKEWDCPHCGRPGKGNQFGNHILWCEHNPHRGMPRKEKLKLNLI